MSDEQTLRERIEGVFDILNARADQQIMIAESSDGNRDDALMYALGVRFARDILGAEFQELWPEDDGEVVNE